MAEVIESDEGIFRGPGAPQRYPWAQWFDGQIWKLKQGEDFTSNTLTMAMTTYQRAHRLGGKVQIRKDLEPGVVYIRYVAPKKPALRSAK